MDRPPLSQVVADIVRQRGWATVLECVGNIPAETLKIRRSSHTLCPLCGHDAKRKQFRFDDRNGRGSWVCVCGHGTGMDLLQQVLGLDFTRAAQLVISWAGGAPAPSANQARRPLRMVGADELTMQEIAQRRAKLETTWRAAKRVTFGDPVWAYLARRIPGLVRVPSCIRFAPGLELWHSPEDQGYKLIGRFPAMLAAVVDDDGRCTNIHRTYLTAGGHKLSLSEMPDLKAKKLMSGTGAKSYAIRLAPHTGTLGVAEGIETALAAAVLDGQPTWALVSTSGMKSFRVPSDVTRLVIYADNDQRTRRGNLPGWDAAQALAQRPDVQARVRQGNLVVRIETPARVGADMDDLLIDMRKTA